MQIVRASRTPRTWPNRGDPRAPALIAAELADSTEEKRSDGITALRDMKDDRARNALIAALRDPEKPKWGEQPTSIRQQAADALAALGDSRAVPALITALDEYDMISRAAAARALGTLKDARAVAPLITALRHFTGRAPHRRRHRAEKHHRSILRH